jgi:DNA excision repair protein ERCC-4
MTGGDPNAFTIVVDSREQQPYEYPGSVVKGLPSGDYSVLGYEDRVAIERKSKADAYASLGGGRARFEREVQRLAKLDYAAVVIESTLEDFLVPPAFTRMNPKSAVNSIIAWSVKYRVGLFFAGNRGLARTLIYRLLEKFVRYANEGIYGGQKPSLEGLQDRRP